MKSLKVLWQTSLTVTTITLTLASGRAIGASFSGSTFDPGKIDSGIPGFVGPDGLGKVTPNNFVNPLFVGWATGFQNYLPAPGVLEQWQTPQKTLGEVTAAFDGIASLGDLKMDLALQIQVDFLPSLPM